MEDAKPLFEILSDHDVIKYLPWKETPPFERVVKFVEEQIRHWNNYPYGWWALEKSPGKELMGWCGLQHLPKQGRRRLVTCLGSVSGEMELPVPQRMFHSDGFTTVGSGKNHCIGPSGQSQFHRSDKKISHETV